MVRGKRTPPDIVRFIIEIKDNAPELTQSQIADKVLAKFGVKIDKTSVGRWLKNNNHGTHTSQLIRDDEDKKEKQITHIRKLQTLARNAINSLPEFFPELENTDANSPSFYLFNVAVVKAFRRLIGDLDWINLAAHLGDEGTNIEEMAAKLDDLIPGGKLRNPDLTQYKTDLWNAWIMIKQKGLRTIDESSDTRKWEYEGLNQKCPGCS
jgi:hypothetical protein